ncbi:hypothetical protein HC031_26055 [Planosporangium thailandense]|uniref:Maleylpyruvate isomerase family mycothiol-dependent enzyme n=1 Tax=Planosporangium thailandense TaxID=765197 RepID=A0ABX0Y426_9ACTN|nr:hypothetical protein [Planosporangium thailandense]NJC73156.1 hypothetical protein [Planosporangium thailandense]
MPTREVYARSRRRLLDLAAGLDEVTAARDLPALPGWSVKDAYAHLAGVCADVLDGRQGLPLADWGERTVAERRERSLADVVAEWATRGPDLDERLDGDGSFRLGVDVWSHEHDIRGALHLPAPTPTETAWVVDQVLGNLGRSWPGSDAPSVRLTVTDGDEHVLGAGEPAVALRCDAFTLGRLLMGRRSRRQVASLDWSGDPRPVLDRLFVFGPADENVDY